MLKIERNNYPVDQNGSTLTQEIHDHQVKHQIAENKISKSTLWWKILEFLVFFVHLDTETNCKDCCPYTGKYSRKERVKWK
uniref:Dolichyl-diphosphooligosaccharideprotein glycosyltransferase subunit DAD1 n=1 Tax=Rhizophora mucronata TaxID=61149 RepID=A0A2P2KTU7_RHIMU